MRKTGMTAKIQTTKEKINCTTWKLEIFVLQMISRKEKYSSQNSGEYLQITYLIRDLYLEYIQNSYNSRIKGNQTEKWAKDLSRHFSKEDIKITNKHMRKCSTSLTIRKRQIETTMRYQFTPTKDG
uniref:Uncharacterized protein n=1 Tax=Mustela putorius furo TaxID=9669 RepID=M3XWV3_MUSPF